uniref:glutaminase n=1 Tax=Pygocentrus nattereri TaxID=42514 RepID=A0AAR2KAL6_PYGNA
MNSLKTLVRTTSVGVFELFAKDALKSTVRGRRPGVWSQKRRFSHGSSAGIHLSTDRAAGGGEPLPAPCGGRGEGLFSGLEDLLFYTITEGEERVPISHFIAALKSTGLLTSDPRLRDCMEKLRQAVRECTGEVMMDRELFRKFVGGNIVLLSLAFRKKFIIPEFEEFVAIINQIYNRAKEEDDGQVADYIPHLAKFSPSLWGMSLCTVDGQRHSAGDTKVPFCLQSCVKPLEYAIAVHEQGTEHVHRFVGKEPSGLKFNMLSLDEDDKPHNPMVNAGAIVISSLIKVNRHSLTPSMEYVGFSNATFQSEKETGDRNFAIGYYLKEKKCFPCGADMIDALDFYFQNKSVVNVMFAAHSGDVSALRRFALSSMDLEQKDYDCRTALHVAAAEGHVDVVQFLTQTCKVNPFVKDRWGNIPLDDAIQFAHTKVVKILQEYQQTYSVQSSPDVPDHIKQSKLGSVEGIM